MSKSNRSPTPLFCYLNKRKALLTFDSFSAARNFQASFILAHKNNKIDVLDSPVSSNKKLRFSDYIPPSLASSKFSMLALGRYLKDEKLIDQYNINLIQTGLKLSVLGRKDSQPEGPSVWITSIKDYPVVSDIKGLALGDVTITYKKVDKEAFKVYVEGKEKEKREAKKAGKDANKDNVENEKKRANRSDPSINMNPIKKNRNEEVGPESPGPQNSSLISNESVMSDDYSLRSSP